MRKWITFVLLLLVGAEVFAQGSAPSPPQLWRRKGTADTSIIVIKTGDTVMVYDTAHYTKISIRGANTSWLLPDSLVGTTVRLTDRVIAPTTQIGLDGSGGALVFDNFASSATFYSLIGNGLEEVSGYLTVTIGASVEGSEITNQTIGKVDIDTTAVLVAAQIAIGSSASTDNYAKPKHYIDSFLFGYPRSGLPGPGQVPSFDDGTSSWVFGSGGSGSGDDGRFDMTLDNSDYVLGATTYTGGYINTSTVWQRGDTGINLVKSGQHPGDTILHRIDYARVQRNDGSRDIRVFRDSVGDDTLVIFQDSATYTKITTSNSGGPKFNSNMALAGNLSFFGANRQIDSAFRIASKAGSQLYLDAGNGLYIQGLGSGLFANDLPTFFGSSTNWTIRADTIRASNGQILGIKYAYVDTLSVLRALMRAGQFGIVTSTDTALLFTRDTANDTTKMTATGALVIEAGAGRYYLGDSGNIVGKVWVESPAGTNGTIDSAQHVQADTTISKVAGKFLGATSGSIVIKAPATAGTQVYTLPTDDGAANEVLGTDGAGVLDWVSGGAGGGNGSADFDSTTTLDSNILKGAGGTILLDVHKNSTPSVVIGKGATMTSLILGGNNSGLSSVDTSLLINNSLYFAADAGDYDRLDSQRVVNAIRLNRYYFTASDFYWSPEKSNAADKMFLTWNLCDTSATWPNNAYKSELFHLADSVGDSHRPLTITWNAPERDSLFSFHWKYSSDSLAGTGSTDTSKMMYPNYALLYVNRTQVDSVFIGKTYATQTADSVNFTDRAIAIGDVVTVQLWFETQVTATSTKRTRCDWAYLNMRRY